jgi:hypothetical protein
VLIGLQTPLGIAGVILARVVEELAKVVIFSWQARRLDYEALAARVSTPPRRVDVGTGVGYG